MATRVYTQVHNTCKEIKQRTMASLIGRVIGSFRGCSPTAPCSQIVRHVSSIAQGHWYPGPRYLPPEDDGCDGMHWFIHTREPKGSREEKVASYIKLVASVLGSEDAAKKAMYSVSTKIYSAVGVIVPENVAQKFKKHPDVLHVLEDAYVDPVSKDYGGEPIIDGQVVPYHPKHHDLYWRAQEAIRQGMIEEGITEFPEFEAYERMMEEYHTEVEKRLKDSKNPKRPPGPFILFMKDFRQQFKEQNPNVKGVAAISKAGGDKWRSMTYDDKSPYICAADQMNREYLDNREYQEKIKAYEKKLAEGNVEEESDKS